MPKDNKEKELEELEEELETPEDKEKVKPPVPDGEEEEEEPEEEPEEEELEDVKKSTKKGNEPNSEDVVMADGEELIKAIQYAVQPILDKVLELETKLSTVTKSLEILPDIKKHSQYAHVHGQKIRKSLGEWDESMEIIKGIATKTEEDEKTTPATKETTTKSVDKKSVVAKGTVVSPEDAITSKKDNSRAVELYEKAIKLRNDTGISVFSTDDIYAYRSGSLSDERLDKISEKLQSHLSK